MSLVIRREGETSSTPRLSHVIASEAKQSTLPRDERMDCFASLAMTGGDICDRIPRPRGATCALHDFSPNRGSRSPNRGSRECRVLAAPAVSCANMRKQNAHEHTGTAGALRHSPRNGLTAYAALSPETNSSCLRRCRLDGGPIRLDQLRHRQLGTSHGCRDHTVLPYAATSVILRAVPAHGKTRPANKRLAPDAACVHRIPSRVRDDARSAPLAETGQRGNSR
jgi:hypothetical protein